MSANACVLTYGMLVCLMTASYKDLEAFSGSDRVLDFVYLPTNCPDAGWLIIGSWKNISRVFTPNCCFNCSLVPQILNSLDIEPAKCQCKSKEKKATDKRWIYAAAGCGGVTVLVFAVASLLVGGILLRKRSEEVQLSPPDLGGNDESEAVLQLNDEQETDDEEQLIPPVD